MVGGDSVAEVLSRVRGCVRGETSEGEGLEECDGVVRGVDVVVRASKLELAVVDVEEL